jgi:hypothetical protein
MRLKHLPSTRQVADVPTIPHTEMRGLCTKVGGRYGPNRGGHGSRILDRGLMLTIVGNTPVLRGVAKRLAGAGATV